MKSLVIIPCYNEEKNIVKTMIDLRTNAPNIDYIIVNDCSKDDTLKIIKKHDFNHLNLPVNLGLAKAMQIGYKYAYLNNYDIAIQFDGDGQHLAIYLNDLIKAIMEGADIAIGSRFVNKKRTWSLRMIGSRIISLISYLVTGTYIKDPTSGNRAINKSLIKDFACTINFPPEPDALVFELLRKKKIIEVPVEMQERVHGSSYLNFITTIKYMTKIAVSILIVQPLRNRRK